MNFYTQVWHTMHTNDHSTSSEDLICWARIYHCTWNSRVFTCLHDVVEMWPIKDNQHIFYKYYKSYTQQNNHQYQNHNICKKGLIFLPTYVAILLNVIKKITRVTNLLPFKFASLCIKLHLIHPQQAHHVINSSFTKTI